MGETVEANGAVQNAVRMYLWAVEEGLKASLTFENAQRLGQLAFEAQFQLEIRLLNTVIPIGGLRQ